MNGQHPGTQYQNQKNPQPQFELPGGDGWGAKISNWIKNNASIVVPVIIIIVLAGLIYAYTQRTQIALEEIDLNEENSEELVETEEIETEGIIEINEVETEEIEETEKLEDIIGIGGPDENFEPVGQITISAQPGEGVTHLARKALAQYLVANPDSSLTKEHKIYIEDYMKDKTSHDFLEIGENKTFSNNLIQEAIQVSKKLNQNQLKNLEQFSQLVPSL